MKRYKIRIEEGQPMVKTLEENLSNAGVREGFIISLAGALSEFSLITIDNSSKEVPPEHFETQFKEKVEITGSGFIEKGKVHIHICCGKEGGEALCGHLVEGKVTYFADVGILVG